MAIYTRKGDRGKTSLYNAKYYTKYDKSSAQRGEVSKDSLRINAIGAIDELNSHLGVTISISENRILNRKLKETQRDLLTIGSILAGSNLRFFKTKTRHLEKEIDEIERRLPKLENFILPGGSKVASSFQYARVLARRAERRLVAVNAREKVKPQIFTFLNRLSDYLFMLARDSNYKSGIKEEVWIGKKKE